MRLHFAVILLAATAILGALISQSATVLVWWRTLIAFMGLLVYLVITRQIRWDWVRENRKIYILGGMVAVHWICFFGSIKLANAATALLCFATITFFTAWIEPWITKRRRETHEIVFGLMVIPGIVLIAGKAEGDVLYGIILGILAALLVAIFSSYEKKWITQINAEHMTMMQMMAAWVVMCLWLTGEHMLGTNTSFMPTGMDWVYLLILGLVCTSVAWVMATRSLVTLSAYDSIMVINLEPVYGILMAFLLLDDEKELTPTFYLGAAIILLTVLIHPIWQKKYARSGHT